MDSTAASPHDPWSDVKAIHDRAGELSVGPQLAHHLLNVPEHLAMVLARYRAAAALIGNASEVVEVGCGEGYGARILAQGRAAYYGIDTDAEALDRAFGCFGSDLVRFRLGDAADPTFGLTLSQGSWDAVVSLDVIEHIPAEAEAAFMTTILNLLAVDGVCVIGTPNAAAYHLASEASKAGHINNYTHERLHELMARHFRVVQSFGMQDTALHLGHPELRHYLLMCGIVPW